MHSPRPADLTGSENLRRGTEKADRSEDVMVTLSLSRDRTGPPLNNSPVLRSHIRSRSLAELPSTPMTRAHSSPWLDSRGRYVFVNGHGVTSDLNLADNPTRRYMPMPVTAEDNLHGKMASLNVSQPIAEHAELDIATRSSSPQAELRASSPVLASHAYSRINRRRPSSPLHFHVVTSGNNQYPSSPSTHSSPLMLNTKYNESFPGYATSSTSSLPSTPTSLRSRSPSISSLETIPDTPDAEAAAIEADRAAALKVAADKPGVAEEDNSVDRRRWPSDFWSPSGVSPTMRTGLGTYGTRTDKRKRWSVCGAERRQDLDLETIWED